MRQQAPASLRNLGFFGGAFDPPHCAHIAMARAALEQLALDELRVFPTGQAWHKDQRLSSVLHRVAMSRLAFGDLPRTVVDDRETMRTGPTYTIDTLEQLESEHEGVQLKLHLLIGSDQLAAFTHWRRWRDIVQKATIVVAQRLHSECAEDQISVLKDAGARVILLHVTPLAHSATAVRTLSASAQPVEHLVTPAVARYIEQHCLYQIAS